MGVEAKTDDGACGGTGPARTHTPLKATGLPPAVPSLQTIVMDQIMPGEEIGCWIPGRELIPAMLRWICETYAFETAYDLLQSFPRFCGYRHNASIQHRTCEKLLVELFPDRMDFTHKRRLHMAFQGENKNYTQGDWLQVLHQESRGKYELEYRIWHRILHAALPALDESTRQQDQLSAEREAAWRKRKQQEREEAEAAAAKEQQDAKAAQAANSDTNDAAAAPAGASAQENANPNGRNGRQTRRRRTQQPL